MRPSALLRWHMLAMANEYDQNQRLQERRQRLRNYALMRDTVHAFRDLSDEEFEKTFRLGKAQVKTLIEELRPYLPAVQRFGGIPPDLKILIALEFYANGTYQTQAAKGAFTNMCQSSVSRAVQQVTLALNKVYNTHIVWPATTEERNAIKEKFHTSFGIPGVVGCIDCTHVSIINPTGQEDKFKYKNANGYNSLNVLIICDADLNIICVDANSPGSTENSMVWQSHSLSHDLLELNDSGEQVFLLGNRSFPLRASVMTPIMDANEGTLAAHYNSVHMNAYKTVKRCIDRLKTRFRCLLTARALHYNPVTAANIVNACCILHNIANKNRMPVTPLSIEQHILERLNQMAENEIKENCANSFELFEEFQRGRTLQQELVQTLWRERLIKNTDNCSNSEVMQDENNVNK